MNKRGGESLIIRKVLLEFDVCSVVVIDQSRYCSAYHVICAHYWLVIAVVITFEYAIKTNKRISLNSNFFNAFLCNYSMY